MIINCFVYQKALYEHFTSVFSLFDYVISFVNSHTQTQIQKVILNSKTGFKRSFERFLVNKTKSESKIYIVI